MIKIVSLVLLTTFFSVYCHEAWCATEFTVTVKSTGGDYRGLLPAYSSLANDLTAQGIKVFSISSVSPTTINPGESVRGQTSGATGTCVKINAAKSQILIKGIRGTFRNRETVQKIGDPSKSISLSSSGDSPIIGIALSSISDTGGVGANYTTSSTNYIRIYTTGSGRHNGVWDDTKYKITSNNTVLYLTAKSIVIDGLQIFNTNTTSNYRYGIRLEPNGANSNITIKNCIIRGSASNGPAYNKGIFENNSYGTMTLNIINNIIYDFSGPFAAGIETAGNGSPKTANVFNNTVAGCTVGIRNIKGTVTAKNNLLSGNNGAATGIFASGTNYNATNLKSMGYTVTAGGNTNDRISQIFSFRATRDFHLTAADTGAKDRGIDLGVAVATDNEGEVRNTPWDIGADEFIQSQVISQKDTIPPVVTEFKMPSTYNNLTVPITGLKANDNMEVVAYIVTESATPPSPTDTNWQVTPPTSFTFGSEGNKIVYAWAKDAANNISNSGSSSLKVESSTIPFFTESSLKKVRPYSAQGNLASISLLAAKNSTASAQVILSSMAEALTDIDVSVSIDGIDTTLYRVDNMHVVTPSHMLGDTGEWPDILLPKTDTYYGEKRNSFPFNLTNISKAYPLIKSLPAHSYGTWRDGKWYSNVTPASGYVYPYTGMETAGGGSSNYNAGTGSVITSGTYTGTANARYIVVIDGAGAVGTATFKWSRDNGETWQGTGVTTSAVPIPLEKGMKIAFPGDGAASDFAVNDEWVFYVGPVRNQAIWLDMHVPANATSGTHIGTVTISAAGKTSAVIPVSINVYDFTLPSTSSLVNFFGGAAEGTDGHGLSYTSPLDKIYVAAGLNHRISMGDFLTADSGGGNTLSCATYNETTGAMTFYEPSVINFDNVMGAYLDGRSSTYVPAGISFRGKLKVLTEPFYSFNACPATDTAKRLKSARQLMVQHLKDKGWFDRLYIYLADEPSGTAAWENIQSKGQAWRDTAPDVPLLVTTKLLNAQNNGAAEFIDVYVPGSLGEVSPLLTDLSSWYFPRANYDNFLSTYATPKHEVWSYAACIEAGGCNEVGGSYFTGWSNYAMDSTGIQNLMRTWFDRYYDYRGELYYSVNYSYYRLKRNGIDPYSTNYWFGVNGDGTLFYPGTPEKIGGTTHIPVESLRLKIIRASFEDYELMHQLDSLGKSAFVNSVLAPLITDAQHMTNDPAAIESARRAMLEEIVK